MRRGDTAAAQRHFEVGLSLTDGGENDWLAGYIECHWAETALQNGDVEQAERLAIKVIERLPDSGKNRSTVAIARFIQAQIAAERGEGGVSRRLAEQSAKSLQAIGHARAAEVSNWVKGM